MESSSSGRQPALGGTGMIGMNDELPGQQERPNECSVQQQHCRLLTKLTFDFHVWRVRKYPAWEGGGLGTQYRDVGRYYLGQAVKSTIKLFDPKGSNI